MTTIETLLKEGIHAHQTGDLAEAARLYQAALELDADNASAHNNLGFVLGQQQQWPEALTHLRTAIRLNPNLSMAHSNLGQVMVATGQIEEGIEHLETAVSCDSDNATAWDNLARMRLLLGNLEGGEYAASRALKLAPNSPHLLTRLGTAVAAQKRFAEAIQYFQQAIAWDNNFSKAWLQLGITRFLRNDLGSAQEALEIATSLNPNDTNALRHLALVRLSLGHREDAIASFERLLALQPDDETSRLDLAVLYLSAQQPNVALTHLALINGSVAASSKFIFYQGLALQQNGQAEQGNSLLRQLAEQHDNQYCEKARQLLRTH